MFPPYKVKVRSPPYCCALILDPHMVLHRVHFNDESGQIQIITISFILTYRIEKKSAKNNEI